jgi:hypothetical protein
LNSCPGSQDGFAAQGSSAAFGMFLGRKASKVFCLNRPKQRDSIFQRFWRCSQHFYSLKDLKSIVNIVNWLVVWNIFYFSTYWE